MRVERSRKLGIILAITFRVGTNQAWRPVRSEFLVDWLAIRIDHDVCLAQLGAIFSPILGLVDAGELLTGECSVVPFSVTTFDIVGGIANASPQFNLASIRVGLLRREETTEACTRVDELRKIGRGCAFAVDNARIVGIRHNDESADISGEGVTAQLWSSSSIWA